MFRQTKDYVHRIGRTARASERRSLSLVVPNDMRRFGKIEANEKSVDKLKLPEGLGEGLNIT